MAMQISHRLLLLTAAALGLIVGVSLAQKPGTQRPGFEYRIIDDVEDKDLIRLSEQGWEYAGYLGQGVKGTNNDETLWRRPVK